MNTVLLTERLELVPVNLKDTYRILSLLRNDNIKFHLCDNKDVEESFVDNILAGSESLFEELGIGLWIIRIAGTFDTIGFCGFFKNKITEIIYVVHPDYQRKGYATEAAKKITDFCRQLNLKEEIYAKIDEANVESIIVAEKIGMIYTDEETNPTTNGLMKVFKLKLVPMLKDDSNTVETFNQ